MVHSSAQHSAAWFSAEHHDMVQCSTSQHSAAPEHCGMRQHRAVLYGNSRVHCSAVQCSAMQDRDVFNSAKNMVLELSQGGAYFSHVQCGVGDTTGNSSYVPIVSILVALTLAGISTYLLSGV